MMKPLTEGKTLGGMSPKIPSGKPRRPIAPPPCPKPRPEELTTKVTNIAGRYHCRLLRTKDGSVVNEMACEDKRDINLCMRYMMRMYDKCGGMSKMADNSRHRPARKPPGTVSYIPKGKVWYPNQIPI